jgi:ribonucleoside-diphosphate reductase alpha chain
MDMTNISVILDDAFFEAYEDENHADHDLARKVYWTAVEKMVTTGEPGFSVDVGENAGEHLRNACTEVTSRDDNDICNLGSINLARVDDIERFAELVNLGTAFLLCGTLYSKVPYQQVADTRTKNRRLGLGLMGIYEWLVKRGYAYEPNVELGKWLEVYECSTIFANMYADRLGISRPVKTRAIAPTGTIGILAETTTGIEPLFATAYKRRYLKGSKWHFQYVIDATAQRLVDQGIDPEKLETAYDLAKDPGRRLAFQAWVQQYVDHGISSTLNLPSVEDQTLTASDFGETLMRYLPELRGVTVYPDGARGGQPLNVVPYSEAAGWEGLEYEEVGNGQACVSGVCGV